jgi:hypothetical protein
MSQQGIDKEELEKIQKGYIIPEYIPFPHKNEKRWKETLEAVKTEIKNFEDLKVTKFHFKNTRKYVQHV